MQEYEMNDDQVPMQYSTEDVADIDSNKAAINIQRYSMTSEITLSGQKITVVNPEYIVYMNQQILDLRGKYNLLQTELQNQKTFSTQREKYFGSVIKSILAKFEF